MKLITWNVNSIRLRLPRLLAALERHRPDVVCLQETKVEDHLFPTDEIERLGYHATVFGQKAYNGVALLSRQEPIAIERGFTDDPAPAEARVISATFGRWRVVCVYVVNGQAVASEKYRLKLRWLDALTAWIARRREFDELLLVTGDFNVAPDDRDVYDPRLWRGRLLCTDDERDRLRALEAQGFSDLLRIHNAEGGIYSWWDYRHGAFGRDNGLRIDLVLGSPAAAARSRGVVVDKQERHPDAGENKPSDHAPVIATFA